MLEYFKKKSHHSHIFEPLNAKVKNQSRKKRKFSNLLIIAERTASSRAEEALINKSRRLALLRVRLNNHLNKLPHIKRTHSKTKTQMLLLMELNRANFHFFPVLFSFYGIYLIDPFRVLCIVLTCLELIRPINRVKRFEFRSQTDTQLFIASELNDMQTGSIESSRNPIVKSDFSAPSRTAEKKIRIHC